MISCVSSGRYHHVWCILYTNMCALGCKIPEFVSVACSPMFASELLKVWVVTHPSLTIAVALLLVRLWVLVLLLTNSYCQLSHGWCMFWAMLLIGQVFSRASGGCTSLFLLLGSYTWLAYALMWCFVKMTPCLESFRLWWGILPIPIFWHQLI